MSQFPVWLNQGGEDRQLPDWLLAFRQSQSNALMQKGLPTRKDERWKYTDLTFLTNKHFSAARPPEDIIANAALQAWQLTRLISDQITFIGEKPLSNIG